MVLSLSLFLPRKDKITKEAFMSHFTIKLRQILHKTRDEWAKFAIREMEISPNTIAKFYGYKSSCDLEQILKQDENDANSDICSTPCARSLTSDVSKTTIFD
ncbi:hypothetical protein CGG80_12300 [Vibrio parahaemolyticus]|nr:hypothetical protein AL464_20705 [Vibrio parahaemolyticus]EGR0428763.1 hypothetical protein [Vibrio parahaemolyticus]EGR5930524.1 hypothetical protein [Vibrio parahaemolyticus]TOH48813.1 hypothetical protein CGI81_07505 [Vibrio parahaemolyticus]TOQ06810.1 hypothetical protein CGH03_06695 [Vibrio parahaemolyticus]